ncbi:MAG: hypothetical protein KDI60_16435 [Xanthomonadales bacterium]|nr:hypothetical protein [Xanthomonadales bacterium]
MSSMNLVRLNQLLDAYGASPGRWPDAERAQALHLLAGSAEARALQAQAALLDASLDEFRVAPPSRELRGRILDSFPPRSIGWRAWLAELWQELGGWRLVAPAFAASLSLGAVLPNLLDQAATDLPDEDLIAAVQLVDNDFGVQP